MLRWVMGGLASATLLGLACTSVNPAYLADGSEGVGSSTAAEGGSSAADDRDASTTRGTGSATSVADASDSQTTEVTTSGEPGCGLDAPCPEHSQCVDTDGVNVCVCDRGYQDDNGVCVAVEASLDPLLWRLDCQRLTASCSGRDVCTVDMPDTAHMVVTGDVATLVADETTLYAVTLRLRGVVEPKAYLGGVTNEHWNEGGTPNNDGWNTAMLSIEDPPREVFVNAGPAGARFCYALDEEHTVVVRGGAKLGIQVIDPNNCAIANLDAPLPGGEPIAFEGIDDPPQPHEGQFLYVEAIEIAPVGG